MVNSEQLKGKKLKLKKPTVLTLKKIKELQFKARNEQSETDWVFNECLANDPLYAKPDTEKKFILWEAQGEGIKIETVDDLKTNHKSLYDFFVIDENTKQVRFPFNSGDSTLYESLSPKTINGNKENNKNEVYYSIPRWSTASRSCLALVPHKNNQGALTVYTKDLNENKWQDSRTRLLEGEFDKANSDEWESLSLNNKKRFYQTIATKLDGFCSENGAKYNDVNYRLYSIKTGVSYIGSKYEGGFAQKNILEANSAMAMLRSNAILKVLKNQTNKQKDSTFRLQVELMTVTAPVTIEEGKKQRDGFQVRDLSSSIKPNEVYLPSHAIPYSQNAFHTVGKDTESIKEDVIFWSENFARPLGMAKAKMFLMFGLIHTSANAQNFVLAFDKNSFKKNKTPTLKGFILRDIGDTSWHDEYISKILVKTEIYKPIWKAFDRESSEAKDNAHHLLKSTSSEQYPPPYMVSLATNSVVTHEFDRNMMDKRYWSDVQVLKFLEVIAWGFLDYIVRAFNIEVNPEIIENLKKSDIINELGVQLKYPYAYPGLTSTKRAEQEKKRQETLDKFKEKYKGRFLNLAHTVFKNSNKWLDEASNKKTTRENLINIQEAAICAFVEEYILNNPKEIISTLNKRLPNLLDTQNSKLDKIHFQQSYQFSYMPNETPVLLNGMKVIFDKSAPVYPVSLANKD